VRKIRSKKVKVDKLLDKHKAKLASLPRAVPVTADDMFPPAADDIKAKPKRKWSAPVNVKSVLIYLTPEQHDKVKALANHETAKLIERLGDVNMNKPPRISVSDYIRTLIDRQPLLERARE
jgi:hypothetical protein